MRHVAGLLFLVLLVLLPSAAAQAAPTIVIAFDGAPNKVIAASETELVPVNVAFTLSNAVCTGSAAFRVVLAATTQAAGNASGNGSVRATPSPAEINFTVPQGAYGSNAALPAARPFTQKQPVTIAVTARNQSAATNVTVAATATLGSGATADCRGSGATSITNGNTQFRVDFGPTAPGPAATSPKLPLPPAVAILALVGALWFMRRRAA